jgi:hypothetical protein
LNIIPVAIGLRGTYGVGIGVGLGKGVGLTSGAAGDGVGVGAGGGGCAGPQPANIPIARRAIVKKTNRIAI